MDKLNKLISDFLSTKFEEWKLFLTESESKVFDLFYIKCHSIVRIAQEMDYSDRQVNRLLKSAREKVGKHIA